MARVKSNNMPWPLVNKKVVGRGGGAPGSYKAGKDDASVSSAKEAKTAAAAKEHMKKSAGKVADGGKTGARIIMADQDMKQRVGTSKYRERDRSKIPVQVSQKTMGK